MSTLVSYPQNQDENGTIKTKVGLKNEQKLSAHVVPVGATAIMDMH